MKNCNDCFLGDYQTGTATLVPARDYGVNIPGQVVIPEDEMRPLVNTAEYTDYWTIHDQSKPHFVQWLKEWADWMHAS